MIHTPRLNSEQPEIFTADEVSSTLRREQTAEAPWLEPGFLGEKPFQSDYGCILKDRPVPCSDFQQLRSYVAWDKDKDVKQVWVPESPYLLPTEEVPYLFDDVYHREQLHRAHPVKGWVSTEAVWLLLGVTYILRDFARGIFFLLAFAVVPILQRMWDHRNAPRYSRKEALDEAEQTRFGKWVMKGKIRLTWWMAGAISLVWVVQFVALFAHFGDALEGGWSSADAAGLVKGAVWNEGEWWRLFTATVMHVGIWHILFNMLALLVLGAVVERVAGWHRMAIVFLLSALAGSLFSLVLLPATSVGSSGGIMGLLGFLLALGYMRRGVLPGGIVRSLLSGVGTIFVVGLVGFMIIDNAAHLGGLLCGALLGLLASRTPRGESGYAVPLPSGWALRVLGASAIVVVAVTIAATFVILFQPT